MTYQDVILDIAEDVIWDTLMTGESLRDTLDGKGASKGLTAEDRARVEHAIQCANIHVWWDRDFVA